LIVAGCGEKRRFGENFVPRVLPGRGLSRGLTNTSALDILSSIHYTGGASENMAVVVPLFDPTNYKQVRARIRKLYEDGFVKITKTHAWPRMRERQIEITDVQHVINSGRIVDHCKPGVFWRYTIEGRALDADRQIRVIVEINGFLIVVSVILLKGGRR
jgi:hypothetical protein